MILVSTNIRYLRIFAGVTRTWGVKRQVVGDDNLWFAFMNNTMFIGLLCCESYGTKVADVGTL